MFAAWTYSELETAIPKNSRRVWCHLVSKELPTLQIILGLPVGQQQAFLRKGYPWRRHDCPVPRNHRLDWFFARTTLFSATVKYIPAAAGKAVLGPSAEISRFAPPYGPGPLVQAGKLGLPNHCPESGGASVPNERRELEVPG
jgi:hypothetical protein